MAEYFVNNFDKNKSCLWAPVNDVNDLDKLDDDEDDDGVNDNQKWNNCEPFWWILFCGSLKSSSILPGKKE